MDDTKKPAEKRPVGAPRTLIDGRRVQVFLDPASLEIAAEIGNGNVSAGIRIALEKARAADEAKT